MQVNVHEHAGSEWSIALTANSTATAFAARIPTTTKPAGASGISKVIEVGGLTELLLIPYGTNSDNDEFDVRVIGWKKIPLTTAIRTNLWIPSTRMEGTAILNSALPGIAASHVIATEYFADTFTVDEGIGVVFQSTNAVPMCALVQCDITGFDLIEIDFDLGTGAAAMNCLYSVQ